MKKLLKSEAREEPKNWREIWKKIEQMRKSEVAPVDKMVMLLNVASNYEKGCEMLADHASDPNLAPVIEFFTLIYHLHRLFDFKHLLALCYRVKLKTLLQQLLWLISSNMDSQLKMFLVHLKAKLMN